MEVHSRWSTDAGTSRIARPASRRPRTLSASEVGTSAGVKTSHATSCWKARGHPSRIRTPPCSHRDKWRVHGEMLAGNGGDDWERESKKFTSELRVETEGGHERGHGGGHGGKKRRAIMESQTGFKWEKTQTVISVHFHHQRTRLALVAVAGNGFSQPPSNRTSVFR